VDDEHPYSTPWWAPRRRSVPVRISGSWGSRLAVGALLVVVIVALSASALVTPPERPRQILPGMIEDPPTLDDLVATCTGLVQWEPTTMLKRLPWDLDAGAVEVQIARALTTDARVRAGFYTEASSDLPSTAEVASYIYQGGQVIWYAPDTPETAISGLEGISPLLAEMGIEFVVVPWPQDRAEKMPSLTRIAAARRLLIMKWGMAQSCAVASEPVLTRFVEATVPASR
jgi:hypothetical protein